MAKKQMEVLENAPSERPAIIPLRRAGSSRGGLLLQIGGLAVLGAIFAQPVPPASASPNDTAPQEVRAIQKQIGKLERKDYTKAKTVHQLIDQLNGSEPNLQSEGTYFRGTTAREIMDLHPQIREALADGSLADWLGGPIFADEDCLCLCVSEDLSIPPHQQIHRWDCNPDGCDPEKDGQICD